MKYSVALLADVQLLIDSPPGCVDSAVEVGSILRIGVGNADTTKGLAAQLVGRLAFRPFWVVELHVIVGVAV